ncbi:MAG: hypothetical protein FH748_10705 [Balneolaceae bacterium]|nr:hypothetical protein [Balneolaceae bacterium]
MEEKRDNRFKWQMLEMKDGITTSNGNWYHITRDGINQYIPGLLQKYTLERIIKEADAWIKSPDALSMYVYLILAFAGTGPLMAAVVAILFYPFWYFNISAFTTPLLSGMIKILQHDGVIYVSCGAAFIYFSFIGNLDLMWVGLGLFFLFKVGLLRLGLRFLGSKMKKSGLDLPDRVLNMLLIRYGMKEGKLTGDIEEMRDRLIHIANLHKQKK